MTIPTKDDLERLVQNVYETLDKFSRELNEYKEDTTQQIRLHKDTVNNVVSLLSDEFLRFQKGITDRLDADKEDRDRWRKFASRKDYAVLVASGCVIIILLCSVVVFISGLFYLIYFRL